MQGRQFYMPPFTKVNKAIIISTVAVFILGSIWKVLPAYLGLSAGAFFNGHIYELLTYPFVSRGLLEVVFNCLLVWFIGCELENLWGTIRYVSFLATSYIGAGLIYLMVSVLFFSGSAVYSYPLMGLHGLCSALLLAYAILYPDRVFHFMLIIPVKAKWFCAILIGMELYSGVFSPSAALAWGHLGAMGCGYCFMVVVSSQWWISRQARSRSRVDVVRQKKVKNSHLTIVKDDDDDNDKPKYFH